MAKSTNGLGRGTRTGVRDRVTNSGQRVTIGDTVYKMKPDAPSGTDFMAGMLEAKPGMDKSDAPVGVKGGERQKKVVQGSMGARYSISPNMNARSGFEQQNVQSNGRIVPSAMGTRRNFGSASVYGSMNG